MSDGIQRTLLERWAEYQRLLEAGASYAALVRLGEIDNVLHHQDGDYVVFRKWRQNAADIELSEELASAALAEAREKASRVMRVVSVGTKFTYEELLYVITLRIELQLLSEFLHRRGVPAGLDRLPCDVNLRNVARSRENISAFRSAQAAAKRNWGLPIRSEWLEDQAGQ